MGRIHGQEKNPLRGQKKTLHPKYPTQHQKVQGKDPGLTRSKSPLTPPRGVNKEGVPKGKHQCRRTCSYRYAVSARVGSLNGKKTPRAGACQAQNDRNIGAPSGDRPSPHNALGMPIKECEQCGGVPRAGAHRKAEAKGEERSSDTPANEKNATAQGNPRSPKSEDLTDGQQ
ncbi:hypothetical protein NDU88_007850 [Pleurodeles waltl]|uniref:Uncharacterized protein n=1 Tax=Pleurodeles waltl TaxID=8319 RepID=A0AAV7STN6_PLEWA|nr:hypothetical protein NDU88_007850 [Pleurodeles waltl]